ncbi:MAG: YIP1 family protein [Phycisphaerales bacterium]|nr:YIP1 family protein [Phycisphaerales bacterium]
MHCKSCQYPLWNLIARTCPECGAPFHPSDFQFIPNAVRYRCPDCAQDYFGTDPSGHLSPRSFVCVACSRQLHMDMMVLLPAEGVDEHRTEALVVPWEDRKRRGFFKGWFGTIGLGLGSPGKLARTLRQRDSREGRALWFTMFTTTVFAMLGSGVMFLFVFGMGAFVGGGRGGMFWGSLLTFMLILIVFPLAIAIAVLLWGAIAHVILSITGGAEKSMGRTVESVAYAAAPIVLVGVPCVGPYLSPISLVWWAIVAAVVVAVAQGVSGFRATIAVLALPLLVIAGLVAFISLAVVPPMRAAMAMAGTYAAIAQGPTATTKVVTTLRSHHATNGAFPAHGLDLLASGQLALSDIYLEGMPDDPGHGTAAGVDVVGLISMSASAQTAALGQAGASIAPQTVAHRVGDMVFTYHGIDLATAEVSAPGLWLVVCAPPSLLAPAPGGAGGTGTPTASMPMLIYVGAADGSVKPLQQSTWQTDLQAQNSLRATFGLAPLPDVATFGLPTAAPTPTEAEGDDERGGD